MGLDSSYVTDVGIFLPEFEPFLKGYSLQSLVHYFLDSSSSRGAKDLLVSTSPSRCMTDWSKKQLVMAKGSSIKRDPQTEELRRFAKREKWSTPSVEDALRLFQVLSSMNFGSEIETIIIMHEPVKGYVLGITCKERVVTLTSHKAEPRKGWYCEKMAFAFRSP